MKRLEDAGHIQRKHHNKGKIYILTDVAADSKIVRRSRVAVAPPPREICPPEFQYVIRDVSQEIDFFETRSVEKNPLERLPPVSEDAPPPIEDKPLF